MFVTQKLLKLVKTCQLCRTILIKKQENTGEVQKEMQNTTTIPPITIKKLKTHQLFTSTKYVPGTMENTTTNPSITTKKT